MRMVAHRKKGNVCRSKTFINPIAEEIEEVEFEHVDELHLREAYYIKNFDCVNYKIPLRTNKEWYKDNREDRLKKQHAYRTVNKDAVNENAKKYRATKPKVECECGGRYVFVNKARHMKSQKHEKFLSCI